MRVINLFCVVYFDLGGSGGVQYNRHVFQARRHIRPMPLGGYCRL